VKSIPALENFLSVAILIDVLDVESWNRSCSRSTTYRRHVYIFIKLHSELWRRGRDVGKRQ
jgi:hypothetical protein